VQTFAHLGENGPKIARKCQGVQSFAREGVQSFALPNDDVGVVVHPSSERDQQQPPNHYAQGVQSFAHLEATLEILATNGVDVSETGAQEVAALDHVTPDLVSAWSEYLHRIPGVRNPPGLLLYKLRTNTSPPRTDERRGGARSPSPPPTQGHSAGNIDLPDQLRKQLDRMGLRGRGPRKEVTRAWVEDPERVQRWASYVLQSKRFGVGYFLTMIRDGEPAPEDLLGNFQAQRGGHVQPEPDLECAQMWASILDQLQLEMTQATFNTWLRDTRGVSYDGEHVLAVGVRNEQAKDWLDARLRPTIERVATSTTHGRVEAIQFVVDDFDTGD
jgi:hypothetical protein